LNSLHRTNPNLFQRLMVQGTSVASLHAGHYILCLLTYELINIWMLHEKKELLQ
jgi:hypothetical protein